MQGRRRRTLGLRGGLILSYLIISYHILSYLIISYHFATGDIPTLTRTGAAPENDFHEIEVIQTGQVNGHDLALGQHGHGQIGHSHGQHGDEL